MELVFDKVTYTYPHRKQSAVNNISFTCPGGSICALIGPNGGGKSTVLQLACGILKPDTGKLLCSEKPAYLPQQERIAYSFSVLEYVLFGRAPSLKLFETPAPSDEARAVQCLNELGIEHLSYKRITELSGGELQLVRIARVLVQDSSILLLDEPTDMLDPAHIATLITMLKREKQQGSIVLMATHDLFIVQDYADYIIGIKSGIQFLCNAKAQCFTASNLEMLFEVSMMPREIFIPYII